MKCFSQYTIFFTQTPKPNDTKPKPRPKHQNPKFFVFKNILFILRYLNEYIFSDFFQTQIFLGFWIWVMCRSFFVYFFPDLLLFFLEHMLIKLNSGKSLNFPPPTRYNIFQAISKKFNLILNFLSDTYPIFKIYISFSLYITKFS